MSYELPATALIGAGMDEDAQIWLSILGEAGPQGSMERLHELLAPMNDYQLNLIVTVISRIKVVIDAVSKVHLDLEIEDNWVNAKLYDMDTPVEPETVKSGRPIAEYLDELGEEAERGYELEQGIIAHTKSGRPITEKDLDDLAEEAESGYDVNDLKQNNNQFGNTMDDDRHRKEDTPDPEPDDTQDDNK